VIRALWPFDHERSPAIDPLACVVGDAQAFELLVADLTVDLVTTGGT
jgi:hypothetical protein